MNQFPIKLLFHLWPKALGFYHFTRISERYAPYIQGSLALIALGGEAFVGFLFFFKLKRETNILVVFFFMGVIF